jgi:hypothetical protein
LLRFQVISIAYAEQIVNYYNRLTQSLARQRNPATHGRKLAVLVGRPSPVAERPRWRPVFRVIDGGNHLCFSIKF